MNTIMAKSGMKESVGSVMSDEEDDEDIPVVP
jgi:hypothetical protein